MLTKLVKYEFKATAKFFALLYGIFIAVAAALCLSVALFGGTKALIESELAGAQAVIIGWLFIAFVILAMAAPVYAIVRFKKSLLGSEGYLMNTLPVSPEQNIASKLIVSSVWTIIGSAIVIFSVVFMVMQGLSSAGLFDFYTDWGEAELSFDAKSVAQYVLLLLNTPRLYLSFYAAMAIGHSFNGKKVLKSFGFYVLISIVCSTFESLCAEIAGFYYETWALLLLVILLCVGLFFVTAYFLRNRLNLE